MAKGQKTGGRDFEPGHPALPGAGRPPMSPEMKKLRVLTRAQFDEAIQEFFHMTKDEIVEYVKAPQNPVIKVYIAKVLIDGINKGSLAPMMWITERVYGKAVQPMSHEYKNPHAYLMALQQGMTDGSQIPEPDMEKE